MLVLSCVACLRLRCLRPIVSCFVNAIMNISTADRHFADAVPFGLLVCWVLFSHPELYVQLGSQVV